jgi:predicted porin
MRKTPALAAVALLAAIGAGAQAQSNVTVYGKLDLGYGKPIGTDLDQMLDAAGSRLGFRGTEDLGGGLKALFGIEHRFNPDTGLPAAIFWHG